MIRIEKKKDLKFTLKSWGWGKQIKTPNGKMEILKIKAEIHNPEKWKNNR